MSTTPLLVLISTALVNNVVLAKYLGLCPFMGTSGNIGSAIGMGAATSFVITLATLLTWLLDTAVLQPLNLGFMRLIAFIVVIAAVVQFTELYLRKSYPPLYRSLGIFLPLITTNCAVLGVALLVASEGLGLMLAISYGLGSSLGFALVLLIFAGLRTRLNLSEVPALFAGSPIAFITAGWLALAFMGFAGMAG
ncbi:MAG: electron transport complex subunit RsxA [Gammaproteobacteria bacterium]|nr:electron transport complex subunit RsxA [Gammaproteobacteria bacterium]